MVQELYAMRYDSPVGQLLVVEKEKALAGLWIEGQKYYPPRGAARAGGY